MILARCRMIFCPDSISTVSYNTATFLRTFIKLKTACYMTTKRIQLSTMSIKPKTRVELHIHLEGAVRPTTVWELLKTKGLPLPGNGSLEDLLKALEVEKPSTLCDFLKGFHWILPIFIDDPKSVERVAYELCEDKANDGVLYMEARFSPHLMISGKDSQVTVRDIVRSCFTGMQKGEKEFGITMRAILICMRCNPETAKEVVELCDEFRASGVVGIDVAGDECSDVDPRTGVEKFNPNIIEAFQEAAKRGVHRTVHAGEAGPANGVNTALEVMKAERIGHGYHVLEDEAVYRRAVESGIHFETCPYSSILSGAVPEGFTKHPIVRFAEDDVSFSISTDDPIITRSTLSTEYRRLYDWGLTETHILRANFNALLASFLPEEEKQLLLRELKKNLNISHL